MTTHKGLTTISVRLETRARIEDLKRVIKDVNGYRRRVENQDEVITRLLDAYGTSTCDPVEKLESPAITPP